jgi:hypothetical protein
MAFNSTNLVFSMWWTVNGINRMWEYDAGADNIATVEGTDYFANGAKIIRPNDFLRVTANDGNAFYVVSDTTANPASLHASIQKLAAGVTSFPS